jgi:hypothetical protein
MPRTVAAFPGPCSARRWAIGQHGLASHYHATPLPVAFVHRTFVPRGYPWCHPRHQGPRATHGPNSARIGTHGRPLSYQDKVTVPGLDMNQDPGHAIDSLKESLVVEHPPGYCPSGGTPAARGVSQPRVVDVWAFLNGTFRHKPRISHFRRPSMLRCELRC